MLVMTFDLVMPLKFPNDSGPIYQETIAGRFPVEPFNTFSNLIFLFIILYFGFKVYKNPKQHMFLAFVLPVIALSYVGGTMFHATRSHEIWLLLDWPPFPLLPFPPPLSFFLRVRKMCRQRLPLFMVFFALQLCARLLPAPDKMRISIGYVITAITILTPIVWYLRMTNMRSLWLILLAFGSFGLAVTFRVLDGQLGLLSMGTHWLWHLFGGIAVFFLIRYIFMDREYLLRDHLH